MTEPHGPATVPPPARTLVDLLRGHARTRPDRTACQVLDNYGAVSASLTYGQLDERVRRTAALLRHSTAPGDRALVMYPTCLDFVVAFFACAYAGVIAVPVPCPDGITGGQRAVFRMRSIVKDADPAVVLTTREVAGLPGDDLGNGQRIVLDDVAPVLADLWQAPEPDPGAPAFLQYTSGSTSAPKGAVISHANVLTNLWAVAAAIGADTVDPDDVEVVSWLPLFHDMGLAHLLTAVYVGGRATLMSPAAFLRRPAVWLETLTRYGAHLSSAPNFAYDLCAAQVGEEKRATLDLSGWRCALNGAEPIRHETLERFAAAFVPAGFNEHRFLPSYGLAEATVYVSGARRPEDRRFLDVDAEQMERHRRVAEAVAGRPSQRIVGCGRVAPNLDVRIVDPDTDAEVGAGSVGEIWITGPSVALGYWQQPEATAERFGGRLAGVPGARFLRTGDLGFRHEGQLYVLGRLDDLIIVDGRNHFPQDIELTVAGCHPALAPGLCAAFAYQTGDGTRIGVAAETARRVRVLDDEERPDRAVGVRAAELVAAIRRAVSEEHQIRVDPVLLLRPGGLPRTTSGKVQRRKTRELYLTGEHKSW
jgi:acyl-CoA synthetase (AMP-forming)/AMP-acid ligase II